MNKIMRNLFTVLTAVVLLSACNKYGTIKPVQKDLFGNATIRNVSVVATGSAKSPSIAGKVKSAVEKEAKNELKGNKQVDLKITLDKWQGSEHAIGGSFAGKLLGSKTLLHGVIDIRDIKSDKLLGRYEIYSKHEEGGLLSAQKAVSFVDTDNFVIEQFAVSTVRFLE